MTDRPILFSGPMVRAILDGRKTQTRRLVTAATSQGAARFGLLDFARAWVDPGPSPAGNEGPYLKTPKPDDDTVQRVYPRIWRGDQLWVRETWRTGGERRAASECNKDEIHYRADSDEPPAEGCWRPSIFLPRWASRITLAVESVRVERLQEITEDDAKAEGATLDPIPARINGKLGTVYPMQHAHAFSLLWDTINGKRAPWASNPWVYVVTFSRVAP